MDLAQHQAKIEAAEAALKDHAQVGEGSNASSLLSFAIIWVA